MHKASKLLAVAAIAIATGFAFMPKASACGSCLHQSAIIESSVITQPAIVETQPLILSQPAVVETNVVAPMYRTFEVRPMRRHLLNLSTPFFGVHLF